jgi:glycosyltransferase involved in cell wall biosynthesis
LNIAIFTDAYWPRVNGVTVSVDLYAQALTRLGNKVIIVCPQYPDSEEHENNSAGQNNGNGPSIIMVPSVPFLFSKEDRLAKHSKIFWVSKQLDEFVPDILHINTEFAVSEFAFYYAKLRELPVVFTYHTLWDEYISNYIPVVPEFLLKFITRQFFKLFLKKVDSVIIPSLVLKDNIKKHIANDRIFLLPTGIEPSLFKHSQFEIKNFREEIERQYPVLSGKKILLFAGRVAREKNIDFLIKILPVIVAKHPDTVLLVVGDGPEFAALKRESARLNMENNCVFTGYLARPDLALVYAISDIFVFPSLTETQGLVTIEAMISGIPVVAIGSMGTKTVMGGDNGGFMVNNDSEEFIARVLILLEDSELYNKKTTEAKEHAKHWIIDNMIEKLIHIYQISIDRYKKIN